ncbi:response regulator transcription factor [Saliterribacillus persicus]|uniref:DNA-binding response OmpR family regulator n=1 Tax=Saliterribacillus persicus TaxID=930114 RepID=A0A368X3J4_9BACI|nr:response regulator transcription factor [Saliterribacillus persicus]RCW62592.1 DNA-binding response OmpR family regulator [Saliterribacillus persicus]
MRIYIVEDDPKIAGILRDSLRKYDYEVAIVKDFHKISEEFTAFDPQLVLLDINLPRFDGFYWCRKIRSVSNCPILFISARDSGMDQVMAIENGGDDYVTKPFQLEVVLAKIKSLLRRVYGEYALEKQTKLIEIQGLTLDTHGLELSYHNQTTGLSKKEFLLTKAFMEQMNHVLSREYLLELLWDDQQFVDDNTLSVNITRVRKKLADLGIKDVIETVRGAGYKMTDKWGQN